MPDKKTFFILVFTVAFFISWFQYMHKHVIPKVLTYRSSLRPYLPTKEIIRNMKDAELEELYYTYVVNVDVLCTNRIRLGNTGDGGWDVCDDIEHRPQSPCLVYSFGINHDFSFDDAVSDKYGCEVHSFDPSMGQNDHKHSDRVFFHNLGISDQDFVNDKAWTMRTLTSIKKQLNHTKINILKMDIELDEFKALPNIIASDELKDVDQLLFEIHYNSHNDQATIIDLMARGLELLRDLRNLGFYVFYSHPNQYNYITSKISGLRRTTCNELHMLNVNQNRK
ncbi:methyltransferase-like protein 24 isoform X2 [Pomacea canaliculata]|uniref:methyltransferase-like protein 24 isoform X2 n=1 Tax=Pomacea canaliculata TaxID=400727 RepID=UPI000D73CDFB|nr:methyltransferase-like protein 24 isoform X2 [Pomacea canaliculata]XP_025110461.1 methyltransferase-like protein 24 isoform X2 [Pomacea canaliculata]XP_025110463.1 methyltransferase-like protein 24 isoform X2 [Pomacea canaliculata]